MIHMFIGLDIYLVVYADSAFTLLDESFSVCLCCGRIPIIWQPKKFGALSEIRFDGYPKHPNTNMRLSVSHLDSPVPWGKHSRHNCHSNVWPVRGLFHLSGLHPSPHWSLGLQIPLVDVAESQYYFCTTGTCHISPLTSLFCKRSKARKQITGPCGKF